MQSRRTAPAIPESLADVALIDGPTAAAAAGMSITKFHDLVRAGEAPPPAIRRPRFTRWQTAAVRQWLASMAVAPGACGRASP
jgi:predicted DNA-binding transcriptional regulator AlpA